MKKILIASLAILLISSAIEAYALSAAVQAVCGANGVACNPATDYVGNNSITSAGESTNGTNNFVCQIYTPSCTGTLSYYETYGTSTSGEASSKGCAYTCPVGDTCDGSVEPTENATLIGCSGGAVMPITTPDWVEGSEVNVALTNGRAIWLCMVSNGAVQPYRQTSGGTIYSKTIANGYASPPNTLPTTWAKTTDRNWVQYLKIK